MSMNIATLGPEERPIGEARFGSEIFLGKKMWLGNFIGSKKFKLDIFLCQKKCGSKRNWVGNLFG